MNFSFTHKYYVESKMFHGFVSPIMGTRFNIVIIDKNKEKCETIWHDIIALIQKMNNMLNRFDSESEVSVINKAAKEKPVHVSSEMWDTLQVCKYYYLQTYGLFDVTLKDFSSLDFNETNRTLSFKDSETSLDFGGFAKGDVLRKIQKRLIENKIKHCFIDFGGSSILGMGNHPYGDSWMVSIKNPFNENEILNNVSLKSNSLSVSGNTPSYMGHIKNPKTGENNLQQKLIYVTTKDPLDAEVLTTALMIADSDIKKKIISKFPIENLTEYNI